MLEVACGVAVEFIEALNAKLLEEHRQNNAAHRVYAVDGHAEACIADSLNVNQRKCKHCVDMLLIKRLIEAIFTECLDVGIVKLLGLGNAQNLFALGCVQKLALLV